MKTKIQLVTMAFDELRINGITSNPDSEDIALALTSLEQLVSELFIEIGWNQEDNPDPNTESGIETYAESAIYMALAVRIAPRYGKDAGGLLRQASSSMSALVARVSVPRQVCYPARMPMGLGNRRQYPHSSQFMPPCCDAVDDACAVSTEDTTILAV